MSSKLTGVTFLLADDDADDKTLFCEALSEIDPAIVCHTASDGKEALAILTEKQINKPNIIFLDINMPVMDGFQFLEEFYKLGFAGMEEVKIVILTSSNSPKDVAFADKYNISGYLNKPLSKEKLEDVLARIG